MTKILMQGHFYKRFILLIILVIPSVFARADSSYRTKVGLDIRGFKTNSQTGVGWLAGASTAHFLGTSNASIGLGGYFGTPQGGNPKNENTAYGGVTLGYDGRMSKVFIWQTGILVGLGIGKISGGSQQSYYTVEPSAGMGFALGGGIRLTLNASYLHMTNTPTLSGTTFGFRIEYKTQTQVKEINE